MSELVEFPEISFKKTTQSMLMTMKILVEYAINIYQGDMPISGGYA